MSVNRIDGTQGNNNIQGTAGIDQIFGLGGNDTVDGLGGNDTIDGGEGNDRLFGNTGSDQLQGKAGNDRLRGENHQDSLHGGDGGDTLIGGNGSDLINGGAGNDVLGDSEIGDDTVSQVERIANGAQQTVDDTDDDVNTGSRAAPILDFDTLIGGLGNDYFIVTTPTTQVLENAGQGKLDVIVSFVNYSLINTSEVEALILTGNASTANGNNLNNLIQGNSLNNTLTGGVGNDTIFGGAGNDVLKGGVGNDYYQVDSSGDVITENLNEGIDFVQSFNSYVLGINLENLTLVGVASSGIGNSLNNRIKGNNQNNSLSGLDGNDTLFGGRGNDVLSGGNGNDILNGYGGNPTEIDVLTGGNNNDTFMLGNATNRFYGLNNASDFARITGFSSSDKIQLKGSHLDYTLNKTLNYSGTSALDTAILTTGGDLIGVVEDNTTIITSLNSSLFIYV